MFVQKIFLDYTYGIGRIYTAEEIEKAKQSPEGSMYKHIIELSNKFYRLAIRSASYYIKFLTPD